MDKSENFVAQAYRLSLTPVIISGMETRIIERKNLYKNLISAPE